MNNTKSYESFEQLNRDIQISKLQQQIAEERLKGGVQLLQNQFRPSAWQTDIKDILKMKILPMLIVWGIKKLRTKDK